MSSPKLSRTAARLIVAALVPLGLAACLRPLYGPTASGERVSDILAAIEIEPVRTPVTRERIGHYLRSELAFELDGSGRPSPKRYRLVLAVTERLETPIVDTSTGRALSATQVANVSYTLTGLDGRPITNGIATASASYDRTPQRFAAVRAARDADIRVAKLLADQIRTRIAAALVSRV